MKNLKESQSLKNILPSFIELETSTYCNRSCSWCPNSKYKRSKLKNFIDFNLFLKIVDDLASINYDGQLALHNYNEPLLDPSLYKYLRIIKEKIQKARIIIFTNGDYLTKNVLKKLEANGVSSIYISLHGAIGNDNYEELLFNNLKK